jgi:hypothetical protein
MADNAHIASQADSTTNAISRITRQISPRHRAPAAGFTRYGADGIARRTEAGPMDVTPGRRANPAGKRHSPMRVSRLSVPVLAAAFLIGVAKGAVAYSRRSSVLEHHVAGTNAITIHVVLAIVAAAVVIAIQVRRSRQRSQPGPSPWSAPFSSSAVAKIGQTIRLSGGTAVVKALPMALLILVLLYCPFRMGAQVIGGLDPNSTVNAWGGPTYAGALLAHWLDCIVGFYVAAFLLGRLLTTGNGRGEGQ